MHFILVVSEFIYNISIPRNLKVYKWCVTKVDHCTNTTITSSVNGRTFSVINNSDLD